MERHDRILFYPTKTNKADDGKQRIEDWLEVVKRSRKRQERGKGKKRKF